MELLDINLKNIILTLYNTLVLPYLKYCIQFWSLYYKENINKLERIQRKVPKLIPRLQNKLYEERLKKLNLFSLSKRRLRGDLIEVFRIVHCFHIININDYVTTDLTSTTRNNGFKIIGKRFRSNEVKSLFLIESCYQ